MKCLFISLVFSMLLLNSKAIAQKDERVNHWEFEIDPIAFMLNGYSFHGIYVKQKIRMDFGVFGIEQPESFTGNNEFKVMTTGVGIKVNQMFGAKSNWIIGLGTGYIWHDLMEKKSLQEERLKSVGLGIHGGYRWFMFAKSKYFQNLYLSPWASLDYNIPLNNVDFKESEYAFKRWSVFPTVHIGYKF